MKQLLLILTLSLILGSCQEKAKMQDELDVKARSILSGLSLKEKVGQMTQLNLDVISVGEIYALEEPHQLDRAKLRKAILEYGVGSILNVGGHAYSMDHWRSIITEIQELAVDSSASKIPILYGIDAIHGANYLLDATLFPQPLCQAASFRPEVVYAGARVTAAETRASGIPWNFSPVLDVARQPLWSRVFETYGEDVYLCKTMGVAAIEGYQGTDPSSNTSVAACMKHFVGYSMPFTGKDRTTVHLSERMLREYFLPSFEAAIEAGAMSVMINSGELNGIPVHADRSILTDLLRDELGFEGVAVTDWEDIMKLEFPHRVAKDLKEAVKMAINAGIDMSMVPNDYHFSDLLVELVEEGEVPMERIDEAVLRILKMKLKLGLFEQPYPPASIDFDQNTHIARSYEAAAEGITLLKNEGGLLPLDPQINAVVTGPAANSLIMVNGAWSRTWQGTDEIWDDTSKSTIWEAIHALSEIARFTPGCELSEPSDVSADLRITQTADVVIACMGERPSTEKPGDIHSLELEQVQIDYIKAIAKQNKPIVLVLVENRPRVISEIEPLVDAVIMAYQPSENGTQALADILYGRINPSGKLPLTYPKYTNSLLPYDHKSTDLLDTKFGWNAFDPQWEFGHGLSYTTFNYSELTISPKTLTHSDSITVSIKVTNTGSMDGAEAVLVYSSDVVASITPCVKRLRGFQKQSIAAGETVEYSLKIPASELAFIGKENEKLLEKGAFVIHVGPLSDTLTVSNNHVF